MMATLREPKWLKSLKKEWIYKLLRKKSYRNEDELSDLMIFLLRNKPSFGLMSKRKLLVLLNRTEKLDFGFEVGLTSKVT